jgi:hypothetical protein
MASTFPTELVCGPKAHGAEKKASASVFVSLSRDSRCSAAERAKNSEGTAGPLAVFDDIELSVNQEFGRKRRVARR